MEKGIVLSIVPVSRKEIKAIILREIIESSPPKYSFSH
jgi:hypothetical protein